MRGLVVPLVVAAIACNARDQATRSAPSASAAPAPPAPPSASPSTAATATPDAPDLASDIAARIAQAKERVGAAVRTRVEADAFVFVAADSGPLFDAGVTRAHDALVALFTGRFTHRPERAVAVYLFSTTAAWDAYCTQRFGEPCGNRLGLYRRDTREIALDVSRGDGTLTHEIVHPIVESDFPMAPAWLNEGLGSLYEAPVMPRPAEIHGTSNWRRAGLVQALASTDAESAGLDRLFGMPDAEFHRPAAELLHYAMARYACQWLDKDGVLWPFYHAWRDGFWDDLTGEHAFVKAVGKTPREANAEWAKWVKSLDVSRSN